MIDIFILYELVKTKPFSAPCQLGSNPKGYTCPVGVACLVPLKFHPVSHRCIDREKISLYTNPVYIENAPIRRIM